MRRLKITNLRQGLSKNTTEELDIYMEMQFLQPKFS